MKLFVVLLVGVISVQSALLVNSPLPWSSLRDNTLAVQLVADSADIGTLYTFSLVKFKDGKKSVVKTLSKKIGATSFVVDFTLPSVLGGSDFYAVTWRDSDGNEQKLSPIGYSPQALFDTSIINVSKESVKDPAALIAKSGISVGSTRVAFSWTHDNLYIYVKGEAVIGFDPGSLKSSFIPHSAHYVSVSDDGSVDFSFFSRKELSSKIEYTYSTWQGDMKTQKGDIATIIIPWYELDMKAFVGRGFGIFIAQGKNIVPTKAVKSVPATWTNLQLK